MKRYLTLAMLLLATAAQAQQLSPQQMQQVRAACEADVKRLCAGIQPGGGRLLACLQQNGASVSQPCADTLKSIQAAR